MHVKLCEQATLAFKDLRGLVVWMVCVAYQVILVHRDPKVKLETLDHLEIPEHRDSKVPWVQQETVDSQAQRDRKAREVLLDRLEPSDLEVMMDFLDLLGHRVTLATLDNQDLEETLDLKDQLVLQGHQGLAARLASVDNRVLLAM